MPTFSETLFPPQEPQPRVMDGVRLKLNKSPIAPWVAGVLINILPVFMVSVKRATLSFSTISLRYMPEVWPGPPWLTSVFAFSRASSKEEA